MKKNLLLLAATLSIILLFSQCSKKGDAIDEAKFGSYNFTTYTIDTIRFRVVMNGVDLTDSLLSPVGSQRCNVSFVDSIGKLQVFNADNNQLFFDTTIVLKIGFSTISIVQLGAGQDPFIVPIPDEPAPAAGNYKVRFQYNEPASADVPFFDSIQCIIKLSGVVDPVDTIILHKYEYSRFYESTLGVNFKMAINNAEDGTPYDGGTNNLSSTGFTDFNTASVYGSGIGGLAYNFLLQRIY
ncbi:MAG: hypothetical protein ABIN36_12565 [Ferruginibacter sp.]